jgi:hypothetical protein
MGGQVPSKPREGKADRDIGQSVGLGREQNGYEGFFFLVFVTGDVGIFFQTH